MYDNSSFAEGFIAGTNSNNNNNGAYGAEWMWWIVILLFFGWGGFGNGFGFGGGNGGGLMSGYDIGKLATTTDVASGFNNSAVLSSLNDLKLGQAGVQQTLCQGFSGVNTAIATNGYETRDAISTLGYRVQDCLNKFFKAIKNRFTNVNAVGSMA